MLNKAKILSLVCALVLIVGLSYADVLEGFNYANDSEAQADWTIAGNDADSNGASMNVYAEATDKQEGSSSLHVEYNYSGNAYFEMRLAKTFDTPQDLSDVQNFTFWLEGDSSVADGMIWYIRFYGDNDFVWRYVDWNGAGFSGWQQISFSPMDMEEDRWVFGDPGSFLDHVDLTAVTKVEIIFQQTADIPESGGTANFYLDALEFDTDYQDVDVVTFEDFNYADTAELQSVYDTAIPSEPSGFALDISSTSDAVEGNAMQYDYTIVEYWRNLTCLKTFDTVQDMSEVGFFKIWMKGDSTIADEQPVMLFVLEDANMNRCWAHLRTGLKVDDWGCYIMPLNLEDVDAELPNTFWQDDWDEGGDCDISQIKKFGLFCQGGEEGASYSSSTIVDKIEMGIPYTPPVLSADQTWNLYE